MLRTNTPHIFRVATANVGLGRSISETICFIETLFEQVANNKKGRADVLVLPELCIPGYEEELIVKSCQSDIQNALCRIQDSCKRFGIGCVLGIPNLQNEQKTYNSAALIDRYGRIIGYQDKMQLVPADISWGNWEYGRMCNVFHMEGIPVGVMICHDKRFPEISRLMVLGGARILFYISCEQWHDDKSLLTEREPRWTNARLLEEIGVYRAQIQARAVENNVWIIKSNVARGGSHGHSCIVNPVGRIVSEAGFEEEFLVSEIDISESSALYATKSFLKEYRMSDWWKEGVEQYVKVHPPLPPPRKIK